MERKALLQFARRARRIAIAIERNGKVEVIIAVVRILRDRLLEKIRGVLLATPRTHDPEIVVHLGERQANGHEVERCFRLRKVSLIVSSQPEVEIRLPRYSVRWGNLGQRRSGQRILAFVVIGLAQSQPGLGIR